MGKKREFSSEEAFAKHITQPASLAHKGASLFYIRGAFVDGSMNPIFNIARARRMEISGSLGTTREIWFLTGRKLRWKVLVDSDSVNFYGSFKYSKQKYGS